MSQPSRSASSSAWPDAMILVHGYANSQLPVGQRALEAKGQKNNPWYWAGKYSDYVEEFNVQDMLENAARNDGAEMQVVFANWDGRSTIQQAVASMNPPQTGLYSLIDLLDEYATGTNTVDLVGHSTGDALIGYVLDKYADNPNRWNIGAVFIAGGAGGGTELATYSMANGNKDPVISQLRPVVMRSLYNHNMRGQFAAVPNIRFVGAGTQTDLAHEAVSPTGAILPSIPYASSARWVRGQSDGLVPFHSQGGVSQLEGNGAVQAWDAYCVHKHTGFFSCGQLNLGNEPATRWTLTGYVPIPLFDGFQVQMIDDAYLYNHSDEVGRLAEWITRYKGDQTPWYSSTALNPVMSLGIAATTVPGTEVLQLFYRGTDAGLYTRWRNPDGTWSDEQGLGGILTSNITAATVPGTEILQIFYRGEDGGVWSRWRNPDGTWSDEESLGGNVASNITAAAVPGTETLQIFYQGTDAGVYTRWRNPDGTWSDEQGLGGNLTSNITAATVPGTETLQIFYRGTDGGVWSQWRKPDGTWSSEQGLGGKLTSDIATAVVSDTQVLQLFYRGADFGVWSRWRQPNGSWSSEQSIGGVLASDVTVATVPGTDELQLFYQGEDGGVWSRWRNPDGTWSDEQALGGILTSDVTAAEIPGSKILQLFYRGQDGGVWSQWRNPDGTWSDEQGLGGIIG
jgi:hypothetical protein